LKSAICSALPLICTEYRRRTQWCSTVPRKLAEPSDRRIYPPIASPRRREATLTVSPKRSSPRSITDRYENRCEGQASFLQWPVAPRWRLASHGCLCGCLRRREKRHDSIAYCLYHATTLGLGSLA
jgi:hypothetical protein